jgi:crotonobetainyl-CoA:carnitine CoA-transferase CaiB-like acyl-CoA transferase
VIENFSPRVMENLGLTYPVLQLEKPDLIMISVSAFGATGPYRNRLGFGPTIDAASGITYLTGYQGGPPIKPGNYFSDFFSGMHAALAVMIALDHRARSSKGTYIDLAMREVATAVVADATIDFAMNGRTNSRRGNRHPSMAPHGCYPCKGDDDWVTISVRSDEEWQRFADAIGEPEWARDVRFASAPGRLEYEDELDALIADWTSYWQSHEVMDLLQGVGVPSAAVFDVAEVLSNPHILERGIYSTVMHPELGEAPIRNLPWKLSQTPVSVQRPSPLFGQHTREILKSHLELSDSAIDELYKAGIIMDEL